MQVDSSKIGNISVTGPGFINFNLDKQYLSAIVNDTFNDSVANSDLPVPMEKRKRVIVDFSSPNLAKKMHVGHLRSTIIGDALCRTMEYTEQYQVCRANHLGDFGTQFGMLVAFLKHKFGAQLSPHLPQLQQIDQLQQFYRDAKQLFDKDALFKQRAHEEVLVLQQGDPNSQTVQVWQQVCDTSKKELHQMYNMLHVKLEDIGESFYSPFIPTVIQALQTKNMIEMSNGAQVAFVPQQQSENAFPLIMQKSDGGYTYDTTDVTALWYRTTQKQFDWCIYIVDAGQGPHFQLVFELGKMAGWVQPHHRIEHVGFGVVLGVRYTCYLQHIRWMVKNLKREKET